jgi:hypothetical protein
VSSAADISFMFYGATYFYQPLADWSMSSVKSLFAMFGAATSFNHRSGTGTSQVYWLTKLRHDITIAADLWPVERLERMAPLQLLIQKHSTD